jgi:trans-aconitate methyltransferase
MSSYRSGVSTKDVRARRAHGYETPRSDVLAHVPFGVHNILELGCSTGALGAAIKRRQDAQIVGVEISPEYAEDAATRLDRVIVSDVDLFARTSPPPEAPFDCLIAADVLEHLVDPWSVLRQCRNLLAPRAIVIISLPNVLYWPEFRRVLRGSWPRDDQGVFDRTHLRWFTRADAIDLLSAAHFMPTSVEAMYWRTGWRLAACRALARTPASRFLAAQYVISASMAPTVP